ncbi:uncharacterized protein LOC113548285 [Rhopalosiphum maidis]|uniref:uncharacterized protein LOC113548285 n=1 Tax=Rhopalosiphum maidis TaxID=43146 RepID=UPI000F00F67A|nr:uncharacterized protein LOC113548285 [Rhopalosiphum maidis]
MDDVNFTDGGRSEFFETDCDDHVHRSLSTIADTLDLAVCQPATAVQSRPLERLSGRWTFRSMPQDVNLTAYGRQFSDEWPSFHVEMECDIVDATTAAKDLVDKETTQTPDGGIRSPGADAKDSTAPSHHPNVFVRQCVTYAGRVFTWDFYRTVCLYFLPIFRFRNRR